MQSALQIVACQPGTEKMTLAPVIGNNPNPVLEVCILRHTPATLARRVERSS